MPDFSVTKPNAAGLPKLMFSPGIDKVGPVEGIIDASPKGGIPQKMWARCYRAGEIPPPEPPMGLADSTNPSNVGGQMTFLFPLVGGAKGPAAGQTEESDNQVAVWLQYFQNSPTDPLQFDTVVAHPLTATTAPLPGPGGPA